MSDKTEIGKIQLEADAQAEEKIAPQQADKQFIHAFSIFMRALGARKSLASIRSAGGANSKDFSLSHAIAALEQYDFKSSFGIVPLPSWEDHWLPMLALMNDGTPVVVTKFQPQKNVQILTLSSQKTTETISWEEFFSQYSGYALLAKKLSESEKNTQNGHWFFSAFRSSRWLYFQVAIAAIVSNFLALTTSIFTMTVYDRIIPNAAIESLYALSLGVILALGFDFIIKTLRARFIDIASKKVDLIVSRKLFNRILNFTASEQQQRSGAMAGIVKEFETLREFFTSSTLVILVDLPFIYLFVYVISLIAGPLAYVPMVAAPLVILVGLLLQPFMARAAKGGMESGVNKQAVLVETLNGLETVKAVGAGPLMRDRYQDALAAQANTGAKAKGLSQFMVNFSASVQQYAQIAIIFYGVFLIQDGTITQGALIAAVILGGRAMAPLGQLANVLSRANNALTAYKSLSQLFNSQRKNSEHSFSISRSEFEGEIEFKNVTFKYSPDADATLQDVSLKIEAGQKVALVGKMGSGKSTFLKLISGALSPTSGGVLLDGIDVRQIDNADRLNNIGVMPQEPWLFSGTIRENIQIGYYEYSDDQVIKAAETSTAIDFVGKLPEGFDYVLKEKGAGLSGGQKQTLCMARAMIHNPKILLLDEPTSALDQNSEKQVVDNLHKELSKTTALIVTHRNAILAMCDRVVVFDGGRIVADGPPEKFGVKKA